MSSPAPPRRPERVQVGPYTLITRLGEGGMGVVHFAQHRNGDQVALKVIRPQVVSDHQGRERLAQEVESLSRVQSPLVAEIVDADPWGPVPYVATRYVAGPPLSDVVTDEGPLEGPDLIEFARELAEALDAVHEAGVIHRDIKPANVLLEDRHPVLIDFGLAKVGDDQKLTQTGWLIGTPGYLAPEILQGLPATEAADIHSWAATIAYAGMGRAPFGTGPSAAIMDRVRRGAFDLRGFPVTLKPLIAACLAPDPELRPSLPEIRAELASPQLGRAWPGYRGDAEGLTDDTVPVRTHAAGAQPTLIERADWADRVAEIEAEQEPDALVLEEAEDESPPEAPPATWAEQVRRFWVLVFAAFLAAAAIAALPYVATAGLILLAWVLRGTSLLASEMAQRRQSRGAKWHDPAVAVFALPWHLIGAIPVLVLLVGWGFALATAGGLLGYAALASTTTGVMVGAGLLFTLGLWSGPGSDRFRGPVNRLIRPIADVPGSFVVTVVLLALAVSVALLFANQDGANWYPFPRGPLKSGVGGG